MVVKTKPVVKTAGKKKVEKSVTANTDGTAKRLSNLKPFQKGQSGNPNGRPKTTEAEINLILECKNKAHLALATIEELMNSKDDSTRLRASIFIIERAYGKSVERVEMNVRNTYETMPIEQLQEAIKRKIEDLRTITMQ